MAILYNADNEGGREFIEWLEKDRQGEEVMLARAAVVVQQMRGAVLQATGCTCSAGITHNKVTLAMIIMLVVHSADVGKIRCWNEQAKRTDTAPLLICDLHSVNNTHQENVTQSFAFPHNPFNGEIHVVATLEENLAVRWWSSWE